MINAGDFLNKCLEHQFDFFTGTPCSYLKPFINYTIDHKEFNFVSAVNEGDAVAIASGAYLSGKRSVVMFQNSGLGNAVNPLTSLNSIFKIPILLIITHRGESGIPDEPQHELMGRITSKLLEDMEIAWDYFPSEKEKIDSVFDKIENHFKNKSLPFALIMSKDTIEKYEISNKENKRIFSDNSKDYFSYSDKTKPKRSEIINIIQKKDFKNTVIIATTGYTGRELYSLGDNSNNFYMIGSMGCALPLSFGISITKPSLRTIVIDGDGALLMRTGSMTNIGCYKPQNFIHILLDNQAHESTGGQGTMSERISFPLMAKSFGYDNIISTDSKEYFSEIMDNIDNFKGSVFIHVKTDIGVMDNLGRPKSSPIEMKQKFMNYIKEAK